MQSGFSGAPVTKVLMFLVGTNSVLTNLLSFKPYLSLRITPHLTRDRQYWRILTSMVSFRTSTELLLALILLYRLRVVERVFGTKKFASFLFITSAISKSLEVGSLFLLSSRVVNRSAPGPYNLISASIAQYFLTVPSSYTTKIFGLTTSDKIFTYIVLLQMCFYQFPFALPPVICGVISGIMYEYDIAGIKYWRFPKFIYSVTKTFLGNIIVDSPSVRRGANTMPETSNSNQSIFGLNPTSTTQATQPPQNGLAETSGVNEQPEQQELGRPSILRSTLIGAQTDPNFSQNAIPPQDVVEEQIATLQTMFPFSTRERIILALQSSNYDPNIAAANLLEFP